MRLRVTPFVLVFSFISFISDVFSTGPFWSKDLSGNAITQQLKENLKTTMLASRAEGTTHLYERSFNKWKTFAQGILQVAVLPADPLHVTLFLQYLVETSKSASAINSAFYSINWAHRMSGFPSPTDHPFVALARDGAIRILSHGRSNRKEPLDVHFLKDLCVQANLDDLVQLRNVVMFVLSFAGFLRSSEVIQLKREDVIFSEGLVSLVIRKSKTDQLRDGQTVVLAELQDSILCPVKLLKRYFNRANIVACTNVYLFRPISVCREGKRLVSVDRPISYSTYREAFKKAFHDIVPDISKYSTHSIRSGGATLAANSGIPERQFQRHGRWKSTKAKDTYVKDSLSSRLSVSNTLSLATEQP